MSTATYDMPLRVVPDIQVTKERFARAAYLRELRGAAYSAYYKAMSLPRSVVRWALSQIHRLVTATASTGVFSWLSGLARHAVGVIRTAGIVPSIVAVITTPPIAAGVVRVARFLGKGLLQVASAAWSGIKGVLGRLGSTGTQIQESLSRTSSQVATVVSSVAKHPMMAPVVKALKATVALVRPVSQGVVAHRLLQALVPVLWLRTMIEVLLAPFLIDSDLVGSVKEWVSTATDSDPTAVHEDEGTDNAQGDLLADTLSADQPIPSNANVPSDDVEQDAGDEEFLNRAERRAQQREDTHTKRVQRPRR